jgi:hypothetical protein
MRETKERGTATALTWLGMGVALLVATVVALGLPNVGLAAGLLSGAYPTVRVACALTVCGWRRGPTSMVRNHRGHCLCSSMTSWMPEL